MVKLLRLLIVVWLLVSGSAAHANELHWRTLEVRARLASNGALEVVERHTMVFSGHWNGGERTFRVEPEQRLTLRGMRRLAPDGTPHELREGALAQVDEFHWSKEHTLRWRSRLPNDRPFAGDELTYEISYALENVLVQRAGGYALEHDFAFPDRDGVIERFSLQLTLPNHGRRMPRSSRRCCGRTCSQTRAWWSRCPCDTWVPSSLRRGAGSRPTPDTCISQLLRR